MPNVYHMAIDHIPVKGGRRREEGLMDRWRRIDGFTRRKSYETYGIRMLHVFPFFFEVTRWVDSVGRSSIPPCLFDFSL